MKMYYCRASLSSVERDRQIWIDHIYIHIQMYIYSFGLTRRRASPRRSSCYEDVFCRASLSSVERERDNIYTYTHIYLSSQIQLACLRKQTGKLNIVIYIYIYIQYSVQRQIYRYRQMDRENTIYIYIQLDLARLLAKGSHHDVVIFIRFIVGAVRLLCTEIEIAMEIDRGDKTR